MGIGLIIVLVVVGLVILWAIVSYNGLVARRARVDESWSGIDVQLKRRHDAVAQVLPALQKAVSHERETLEAVVRARNGAVAAQESGDVAAIGQAEGILTGAMRQIFALSEAYPELQAVASLDDFRASIMDNEDKISAARRIYNGNVRDYNTKIQQLPSNIIAGIGKFTIREFFEVEDAGERAVPSIEFS